MRANPLSTTQTLLNAFRPGQTADDWLLQVSSKAINWDDLTVRAIVFGLAPQLHTQLQAWQIDVPPRAFAKLAVTYKAQVARSQAIYAQLHQFLAACEPLELKPVALKGIHLAATHYADPALRPMNDIDLLFSPRDLKRAEDLLTTLGYQGKHKPSDIGAGVTKHTSTFKRQETKDNTPNPYLSTRNERMIEPHISLEESWYGLKVDMTPGVYERAVITNLRGDACLTLDPEDLLLHIAIHFCFHIIQGAPNLVQLTDMLVVTSQATLDWQVVIDRAVKAQAAAYLLAALTLAKKILAAPVPQEVCERLATVTPPALRKRIEAMTLADLLQRSQQKPISSLKDRLRRGVADRSETARWAATTQQKIAIWRSAMQPFKTDTGRLLLGKPIKR